MTTTTANGKPQRKQLSHQLDRLDRIIDALVEGLPDAVADATRDGTRQAIRDVLTDVLTDPDVVARLRATLLSVSPPPVPPTTPGETPVPPPPPKKDRFARLKAALRSGCQTVTAEVKAIAAPVRAFVTRTNQRFFSAFNTASTTATQGIIAVRILRMTLPLGRFIAVAVAVCLMVAMTSYALPHPVAAILSGVGGATTTLALQLGAWLRRSVGSFGLLRT